MKNDIRDLYKQITAKIDLEIEKKTIDNSK